MLTLKAWSPSASTALFARLPGEWLLVTGSRKPGGSVTQWEEHNTETEIASILDSWSTAFHQCSQLSDGDSNSCLLEFCKSLGLCLMYITC